MAFAFLFNQLFPDLDEETFLTFKFLPGKVLYVTLKHWAKNNIYLPHMKAIEKKKSIVLISAPKLSCFIGSSVEYFETILSLRNKT